MPRASIPSAISPNSSPSQDQPSIAHSTGAFHLSVRSCPLLESTRTCLRAFSGLLSAVRFDVFGFRTLVLMLLALGPLDLFLGVAGQKKSPASRRAA